MSGAPDTAPVVLFDLDDTLFDHRGAMDAGILEYARLLGAPYTTDEPAAEIAFWQELEERHYHAYLAGETDYEGQRVARARDFAARHGVSLHPDAASAWYTAFFDHYIANWRLQDDAIDCLDALAGRGIRLGLITNGDPDYQLRKLAQIGLTDRFEHIVTSGGFGIAKPDARIFRHACALFDCAPRGAAYVGDRLATDAIGAAEAGLTGVWLDRVGAAVPAEAAVAAERAGVIRIGSLQRLEPALEDRGLIGR